jgi:hypothetical protein
LEDETDGEAEEREVDDEEAEEEEYDEDDEVGKTEEGCFFRKVEEELTLSMI